MKKTTPINSPLHKGRDEREKALQYNNEACPPLSKGKLEGVQS